MIKNRSALAPLVLATASIGFTAIAQAQVPNLSAFVPADLVTTVTQLGVEQGLPIIGSQLAGNPVAEIVFDNFGQAAPLTDLVLGGDTTKGFSEFYGPLDALLGPVVDLTSGSPGGSLPGLDSLPM